MKAIQFGKRQGFANEPGQALSQSIEPALDVIGFATVFAHRLMPVSRKNTLISTPEITKRETPFVGQWNAMPELQTTGFTAVADEVGDNLPRAAAQRDPNPALVGFLEHKRPQFIQFQHIIQLGLKQGCLQRWQVGNPLHNPFCDRVPRDTEQTLDAAQTDALQYGTFHLAANAFIIARLSFNVP